LSDIVDGAGEPIGARILDVAAAGHVFLANAPGNGIADDKAMYCRVPELISYYLNERPLLESVPTYRPLDGGESRIVLERVGELVTKPVDGHGGQGVLIGPQASASTVAARRAEIATDPGRWVAQEVVPLSSHPTFDGTRLEPRHVDLRAFVYVYGTGPGECVLADLALTRVASARSMLVNSSQGGGAKDTWIIRDDAPSSALGTAHARQQAAERGAAIAAVAGHARGTGSASAGLAPQASEGGAHVRAGR
jgi:carboxylate-amine ligase